MISWDRKSFIVFWFGLGLWGLFFVNGCATQQEVLDLKPHVNKAILQVSELSNQVYDLENRLKQLENREGQIPDHVRRLADLEARLNNLQEEARSHITAEQEDMNLWKKFDQRFQYLSQEIESERRKFIQFQEETRKKFEELSPRSALTPPGEELEKTNTSEPVPLPDSSGNPPAVSSPEQPEKTDEKGTYEEAHQAFVQQDWPAAQSKFLAFLDHFPKSKLADNAQFWIAESFFNQKNYEKAILEYEKVIQNYPKGDKLTAALLKQALSFHAIGRIKEAKILLKQVIKKAPDSEQARIAEKKLKSIDKEEGSQ
ncbi:MAG: tol-pal system protein YbgF [bacterium]